MLVGSPLIPVSTVAAALHMPLLAQHSTVGDAASCVVVVFRLTLSLLL